MQLKLNESAGAREWTVVFDDSELYEVLCNCIAWRALDGKMTVKLPKEDMEKLKSITVTIVKRAKEPESKESLEDIKDPFIKMILTECNRLEIDLPHK
jgi:hypothetical protein